MKQSKYEKREKMRAIVREIVSYLVSKEVEPKISKIERKRPNLVTEEVTWLLSWECGNRESNLKIMESGLVILESQDAHVFAIYVNEIDFRENWRKDITRTLTRTVKL